MRQRQWCAAVDGQQSQFSFNIMVQKFSCNAEAGIIDHQSNIEPLSNGENLWQEIRTRQIYRNDSRLDLIFIFKFLRQFFQSLLAPRDKDEIQTQSRQLPGELRSYAGGGASNEGPWAI